MSAPSSTSKVDGTSLAGTSDMSVRVRDLMSPGPIVVIGPDDDLERAGNVMLWARVRVVEGAALVGLVSERDLIRARGDGARLVRAAMRSPVCWIGPDDPIESALAKMVSHNFGCLPGSS
jgi:CBS domain-containing protein